MTSDTIKNYQKILTIIIVGVLVIPQVTLAAWWNPASWSIFSFLFLNTPQTQTITTATTSSDQSLLNDATTTTLTASTSSVTAIATSTSPVDKPIKKSVSKTTKPVTQVQTPLQVQPDGTLCNGAYYSECSTGQKLSSSNEVLCR